MKKFLLHGEMAAQFCESIELDVKTMRQAIDGIACNYPSFKSYYVNKSIKGVSYVFVGKTGDKLENFCMDMPLTENEYSILPAIEGAAGAAGMAGGFLGNFALGYAMQWLSDQTKPQDDGTPEYEIIRTNSSIYSQNENRAEQGLPVPVVYGQIRIGSQIIHSSIHNYDMDFDNNQIYAGKPKRTRLSKLIGGADYTFINPTDITDFRDSTNERISALVDKNLDSTKRTSLSEMGRDRDSTKLFDSSSENEALNGGFQNSSDSSNELRSFGPSEDVPTYTQANADWWDHTQSVNPRPYLFPVAGSIDENMRPSASDNYAVERVSKAGAIPDDIDDQVLAWRNASQPLTVGSRGQYQKLESMGIYKSLEVLSEGPIAGLANPITGSDRDNGYTNFPYGRTDPTIPAGAANLGYVKYDFDSDSILSENNNTTVVINNGGENYSAVDGTYILTGDGTPHPTSNLYIKADKPVDSKSARINDISFNESDIVYYIHNNSTPTEAKYYSSNGLFLLNSGDGSIHPNTNNDITNIEGALSVAYLTSEATDNAATTGVFNLNALQTDSDILGKNFKIGASYGNSQISYEIEPVSEPFEYKCKIEKTTETSRVSEAASLDLGSRYLDMFMQSDFETVYDDEYKNSNSTTLPFTDFTWNEMARIYVDGDYGIQGNLDQSVTITVANNNAGQSRFRRVATVTVTLQEYVTLSDVVITVNAGSRAPNFTAAQVLYSSFSADSDGSNYFADNATRTINLGILLRSAAFANALFDQFNAIAGINMDSITLPSMTYADIAHGGGKYVKFGVGSGSNTTPSVKIANNLPQYIIEGGNDNFDSVRIVENGAIAEDNSAIPKGFYSPFIFPRVTVFVLRKTVNFGFTRFSMLPTSIDCVASVSAQGTIAAIHLLRVPDLPVFDSGLGGFTPIMPHETDARSFPFFMSSDGDNYQDIGIYCKIDKSNSDISAFFDIDNESLALSDTRRSSFAGEIVWSDHISINQPDTNSSFGAGMFTEAIDFLTYNDPNVPITKDIILDSVPSNINDPTTNAIVRVSIESIDIRDAAVYKANLLPNSITGFMSPMIKDKNAIAVVRAAKRQGITI